MTIRFILKSGVQFDVKCTDFTISRSAVTNEVTGVKWEGLTQNKPLHIDFDEVAAIVRVLSDETED